MRPAALLLLPLLAAPAAGAQPTETVQAVYAPEARAEAEGRFVRALTAHALGDDSTAAGMLDEILHDWPRAAAVLDARAEVALALDAPAEALHFAGRATESAPDSPPAWLRLAEARRQTGDVPGARDALRTARSLAPDDLDVLLALAALAGETGDASTERDALESIVRVGDTVAARLRLSVLYEREGDRDRALAAARAAARLAPAEPAVRQRLAALVGAAPAPAAATGDDSPEALYRAGRYAEAADALLDLVADDPRRIDAWGWALDALARTADDRADATADDALLLFPSVPSVLAPAAEAYLAAGRPADARDAAQRGLDALALLGDRAEDADALRPRLQRALDAAGR